MKMYEVEVARIDDTVMIYQGAGDDMNVIVLTPEQAELFCKWVVNAAIPPAKQE